MRAGAAQWRLLEFTGNALLIHSNSPSTAATEKCPYSAQIVSHNRMNPVGFETGSGRESAGAAEFVDRALRENGSERYGAKRRNLPFAPGFHDSPG